jgi:hypothetical protein
LCGAVPPWVPGRIAGTLGGGFKTTVFTAKFRPDVATSGSIGTGQITG